MTVHLPSYWRRGYFGSLNVWQNWIGFLLKIRRGTKKSEAAACCWEATPRKVETRSLIYGSGLETYQRFSFVCVFFLGRRAVTCFCYGRRAARRSGVVTQTGETVGAEELRAPSKKTLQRLYLVSVSPPGRRIFHTVTLFTFFFFFPCEQQVDKCTSG